MQKRLVNIFTSVLALLIGVNAVFLVVAVHANQGAARAYEERHALISAIYEASIAGGAFTRLARYYAIVGDESTYGQFRAEAELNRYGKAQDAFTAFGATAQEIELMDAVKVQRLLMFDYFQEVLRLRRDGYIEEAIALAHGPYVARIGQPAGPMSDEVRDMIYERTTETASEYRRTAEIFGELSIVTAVVLAFVGVLWLIIVGKVGCPRRVEFFGAAFLILALANIFFAVSASRSADERLDVYRQQRALVNTVYNAERGTEILTRLSRMYVVTGGETQYNQYFVELERDRFGLALDTFILMKAESSEINVLVDVLGRLTRLRQIESQSMLLRTTGYLQEAVEMAFSPEVANLDRPLGLLGEELREMVNARTGAAIDAAARNHDVFALAAIISFALLVAVWFAGRPTKNTRQGSASGVAALIFRKISNAAIRTKLFASFSIVIVLFTAQVVVSTYFDEQTNRLNRLNAEFMLERSEIVWAHHQEFTEMRRLLRETFISSVWRETANEAEWLMAEQHLTASHTQLTQLAEAYEASVRADPIFPMTADDSRILILSEAMSYIDAIYEFYEENFFLSGNMNLYTNNVADYAYPAEVLLRMLRQFVNVHLDAADAMIEYYRSSSNMFTAISLAAAVVLAVMLTFSMLRTFDGRIKAIEAAADRAAHGDFEAGLQEGADEITAAYSKLSEVFTSLINEIKHVTDEGRKGSTDARIDTGRFQGGYKETALAINALLDAAEEMRGQKEQLQIAQKASEAKSKFLAKMSHEIRTPITAVMGISEIQLQDPSLPPNMEEAFAQIFNSADTLLSIINDILDLSKIEADKMDIMNAKYRVASIISDTMQTNLMHMGSKMLNIIVDVDKNIPAFLIGDELRIRQVISNLLSNAFKYTDTGSVCLKVFAKESDIDGYISLVIEIRDTGRGMTQNQIKILFDEYTRFHEQEARFELGTGLGMSITMNLLEMMNGKIDVDSEPGVGTTITVVLPQQIGSSELLGKYTAESLADFSAETHSVARRLSFSPEPMPYGRVLVVDDVDANIFVAKGLLGLYRLQIDSCTSGAEAINIIENGGVYDIIFMDQMMPEMSGMKAVSILRQMGYTSPIVALTADAIVGKAEMFLESGFDGFLSKPIQTVHLNAILNRFVKDKHMGPSSPASSGELAGGAGDVGIEGYFENYMKASRMDDELIRRFAQSKKTAVSELMDAIGANDFVTAHRLVHNLKSAAGLIHETALADAAMDLERLLEVGEVPADDLLRVLENEMVRVLERIDKETQPPEISGDKALDKDKAIALFDKLAPMLKNHNTECFNLLSDLRAVPETDILARQIEEFDFAAAVNSINALRAVLKEQ